MMERENQRRLPAAFSGEMPSVIRMKFFQTVAGPDDTPYPEQPEDPEDNPTVYYATMLKNPTYDQEVGLQGLVASSTTKKVHIYNMEPRNYIEEGSKILGWEINNRWWTIDKVREDEPVIVHLTKIELTSGLLLFQTNQIFPHEYIDSDGTDVVGRRDNSARAQVAEGEDCVLRWTNSLGRNAIFRGDGLIVQSSGVAVRLIAPDDGTNMVIDNWPKTLPGSETVSGLAEDRKNNAGVYALQELDFTLLADDGATTKTETCSVTSLIANGTVIQHMDDGGLLALDTARSTGGFGATLVHGLGFVSESGLVVTGLVESSERHNAFGTSGDYYARAYGAGGSGGFGINLRDYDLVVNRLAATLDWTRDDDLTSPIMQMCHDPNGGFYAADTAGNISHYDSNGNRDWTTSTNVGGTAVYSGGSSSMIADTNGVAVGNGRGGVVGFGRIFCLDPDGNITAFSGIAGGTTSTYFGMDSEHVYYPNSTSAQAASKTTVTKLNRTTGVETVFVATTGPRRQLRHVVVGGGNVYASTGSSTNPTAVYKFSTAGVEATGGWPKLFGNFVSSMGWNSEENYLCLQVNDSVEQYDESGTFRVVHNGAKQAGPKRMRLDQYSTITSEGVWQNQEGAHFAFTAGGHIVPLFKMHGGALGNRSGIIDAACYNPSDDAYYSGGGGKISKVTVTRAEHVCLFDPHDGLARAPIYSVAISPDKTKVLVHLSVASSVEGGYGKVVCFDMDGNKLWSSEGVGLSQASNRGTVVSTEDHAFVWHTPVLSVI